MKAVIKAGLSRLGFELKAIPQTEARDAAHVQDEMRLRKIGEQAMPLRLHFGCGPRVLKGWTNIDLAYEPYEKYLRYYKDEFYPPAIRGNRDDFFALDITKGGLPLPDSCVEAIFHEDFIEHLCQKEQVIFLAETHRVLKRGAIHRVNTPNLIESMRCHSEFSKGFSGVYTEEWSKHGHRNVLSPSQLAELAYMVGYKGVVFCERNQSHCSFIPNEYRPDPNDRPESGNIFADLIA